MAKSNKNKAVQLASVAIKGSGTGWLTIDAVDRLVIRHNLSSEELRVYKLTEQEYQTFELNTPERKGIFYQNIRERLLNQGASSRELARELHLSESAISAMINFGEDLSTVPSLSAHYLALFSIYFNTHPSQLLTSEPLKEPLYYYDDYTSILTCNLIISLNHVAKASNDILRGLKYWIECFSGLVKTGKATQYRKLLLGCQKDMHLVYCQCCSKEVGYPTELMHLRDSIIAQISEAAEYSAKIKDFARHHRWAEINERDLVLIDCIYVSDDERKKIKVHLDKLSNRYDPKKHEGEHDYYIVERYANSIQSLLSDYERWSNSINGLSESINALHNMAKEAKGKICSDKDIWEGASFTRLFNIYYQMTLQYERAVLLFTDIIKQESGIQNDFYNGLKNPEIGRSL